MCFSQCPPLWGGPMITVVAMINNTREQQGEGWVLGTPSHRMVTATPNSQEDTVPQIGKNQQTKKRVCQDPNQSQRETWGTKIPE